MKTRPILMSAPMVRAILAGTKTQTRRVVKPQPVDLWPEGVACYSDARGPFRIATADVRARLDDRGLAYDVGCEFAGPIVCPYGQPGDQLWVREAFDPIFGQSPPDRIIEVDYRASWEPHGQHWRMKDEMGMRRWKPSIHMPHALSRITLEIVSVRVERLQDIGEEDAIAEGIASLTGDKTVYHFEFPIPLPQWNVSGYQTAKAAYLALWESINGPGSWGANPFVWCVEFKRVEA